MKTSVKLPEGVKARMDDYMLIIEGPKGNVSKLLKSTLANLRIENDKVIIESKLDNRRGKRMVNTFRAHINNLVKGSQEGYEARLAIRYGHFPITVKIEGDKVIIENFVGEKVPRRTRIMDGCEVKVKGSELIVTGLDKEAVGQTAANIELKSRIKNKDLRIFQDGIWITKKPGRDGL